MLTKCYLKISKQKWYFIVLIIEIFKLLFTFIAFYKIKKYIRKRNDKTKKKKKCDGINSTQGK